MPQLMVGCSRTSRPLTTTGSSLVGGLPAMGPSRLIPAISPTSRTSPQSQRKRRQRIKRSKIRSPPTTCGHSDDGACKRHQGQAFEPAQRWRSAEGTAEQQIPRAVHQLHGVVCTATIGVMFGGTTLPGLIHLADAQAP